MTALALGPSPRGVRSKRRQSSVRGGTASRVVTTGDTVIAAGDGELSTWSLRSDASREMDRQVLRDRCPAPELVGLNGDEGSGRKGFGYSKSLSSFMSRISHGKYVSLFREMLSSLRFLRRHMSPGKYVN